MRTILFCVCGAGSFLACHLAATRLLPPVWKGSPGPRLDPRAWYLSTYSDIGLDYYVLRFGLWGCARHIREADVLCVSSSKGMYGFDASLLGRQLSRPGHPVRAYNLSFGFGDGFHYPMEVIKTLDLRDKILIADLTDNTQDYHLSGMAQLALECASRFDAAKILWEKWLSYERDRLFTGVLPKVVYSPAEGFRTARYLNAAQNYRKNRTGDLWEVAAAHPHWARPGKLSCPFCYDQLRQPFFEECRRRNIRIIFTSIPYEGYDPEWGRQIARALGYPYVTVDYHGIELFDPWHMSCKGRTLFSQRLAERLSAPEYGIVAADLTRRED